MQRTQNTDAYLLMQFAADTRAIRPLSTNKRPDPEQERIIRAAGAPVVKGLQANGHSLADALSLMRAVITRGD